MCCQYGYLPGTIKETEEIADEISECASVFQAGDIRPSDPAVILKNSGNRGKILADVMPWGFIGFDKKLLINARAETALEKRMFADSAAKRRCIIPAGCFYEWDKDRIKNTFASYDGKMLCLAGFYDVFDKRDRFIIVTTKANDSMSPVHDRMPLILEKEQIGLWLFDDACAKSLLEKIPGPLCRTPEYEQLSLF